MIYHNVFYHSNFNIIGGVETFLFEFSGAGVITSTQLAKEGSLEILTKDVPIFTLMEGAHVEFEIQVVSNRFHEIEKVCLSK